MEFTLERCKDRGLVGKSVKRCVIDLEAVSNALARTIPVKKKSSILLVLDDDTVIHAFGEARFKHDDEERARKVCEIVFGKARLS